MIFLTYILVLVLLFSLGNFLSQLLGIGKSLFAKVMMALMFVVVATALVQTGFTSIFTGLLAVFFYLILNKKLKFRIPNISFQNLNKADLFKALVFSCFFYWIFYFLGGQVGSGRSLHPDFLYYIDVSWHIDKTGIEGLVTNPVDPDLSFKSGYHYFIPWLLAFLDKLTFGQFLSYEILLHVVFPLLTTVVFLGIADFLSNLNYPNNWILWFLSIVPLFTFGLYFPDYGDIPLLRYGDRFNYGIFNSYWSGKILVSLLIVIPLFRKIIQKDVPAILALLSTLGFLSLVNLPVSLIMIAFVLLISFIDQKDWKKLALDSSLLVFLFLFFQLFYKGKQFIPMPNMSESVVNFFINIRTSLILISENLIQAFLVFIPIIILLIIHRKKILKFKSYRALPAFVLALTVCSSAIWVLFRENFGSSEFYKLVGSTWLNLFTGILLVVIILELLTENRRIKAFHVILLASILFIFSFQNVDSRVRDSYSIEFFKKIEDENFSNEIILNFEAEENKFLNLPGQLNPFVHNDLDIFYQLENGFSIISGSNISSEKFKEYLSDPFASSMLQQDPLFIYSKKNKDLNTEQVLTKFMDEYDVRYLIFEKEFHIPPKISRHAEIKKDEATGQRLVIRQTTGS